MKRWPSVVLPAVIPSTSAGRPRPRLRSSGCTGWIAAGAPSASCLRPSASTWARGNCGSRLPAPRPRSRRPGGPAFRSRRRRRGPSVVALLKLIAGQTRAAQKALDGLFGRIHARALAFFAQGGRIGQQALRWSASGGAAWKRRQPRHRSARPRPDHWSRAFSDPRRRGSASGRGFPRRRVRSEDRAWVGFLAEEISFPAGAQGNRRGRAVRQRPRRRSG